MLAISKFDQGNRVEAFSLLEVVVALGIFAGGILVLLACFPLTTKSVESAGEIEAAAQSGLALLGYLRARPFDEVVAQLQTPAELSAFDQRGESAPSGASRCFYASVDFQRLGLFDDPVWFGHEAERYFEIALVRNLGLSPVDQDPLRDWIAFSLRVRWPLFKAIAGGTTASVPIARMEPTEMSQRQLLFLPGSTRR